MAVFVRTDVPAPPGTASVQLATTSNDGSTSSAATYRKTYVSSATITSLSISLTKKSMVCATFFARVVTSSTGIVTFYLRFNGSSVNSVDINVSQNKLIALSGYQVLDPGSHTIDVYASISGSVDIVGAGVTEPVCYLVVFIVPLE
jgi:hypothetical protein